MADHGLKGLPILGGARHRQGSHGPAVEGMVHGDNFMVVSAVFQVRIFPGRLHRPLHRLRPGVGEKYPVHAGDLPQLSGRIYSGHIVIIIGCMDQLVNLRFQRVIVIPVIIPKSEHCNTCGEVKIFFSLHIVEVHPVPPVQHNLKTVVGVKQHPLRLLNIFLHFHAFCLLSPVGSFTLFNALNIPCYSISLSSKMAVPMPCLVNISNSRQWGILPSRM